MSTISECHEPGLLFVITQPKSSICLPDFHAWYNTEHGPARLKLSSVERGCRYRAVDEPSTWLAMYDLSRISATSESQYTNLRRHRSSREQNVMSNVVDVLERKIYKRISTRGSSYTPAPVMTCVSFVVNHKDVDEVDRWYEEQHIDDLSRIPGWRRSRRFRLMEPEAASGCVELLAIHEFDDKNGLGGEEHMRARYRPWREKIVQLAKSRMNREFRLYHEFKAEDYVAPPEIPISAYTRKSDRLFERRPSLASGVEQSESQFISIKGGPVMLPQVHG